MLRLPPTRPPSRDPLNRMAAYRHATSASSEAWPDVLLLSRRAAGVAVASQLYRSVGSVGANLAEGYSRSSGLDRARFFEYALGSAREGIHWYRAAAPMLNADRVRIQVNRLDEIVRILLMVIPRERRRTIRPRTGAPGV